jgi:two-component system, sensor histidine kinase and response regulator
VLADDVIDEHPIERIRERYAQEVDAQVQASDLLPGAVVVQRFFADMKPTGRWLYTLAVALRDPQGRVIGAVQQTLDVTEQVLARRELQQAKEQLERRVDERTRELDQAMQALQRSAEAAEAASRAKSEFVANISHEIRNPLNAISGMSMLVRRGALSPVQIEQLDKLDHAVAHVVGVINSVLDLSKIESGKLVLAQEPLRLDEIVADVVSFMAESANAKGLALTVQSHAEPAPMLLGDATRLRQALVNYVANAIKFTERGSVTVHTHWVPMDADDAGSAVRVRLEVQDTGPGLAAPTLARLFQPFEQANDAATHRLGGTGLGLSITRHLAQAMGGESGGRSEPGVGSTFWFTAALALAPVQALSTLPHGKVDALALALRRGRRMLAVDDSPVNLEILAAMLEAQGHDVDRAEDGLEAVELVRLNRYELIFTDVQMPTLDGIEATRRIRALPHGRDVPIVAMTGNAFLDDEGVCLDAGMNDFIPKPVDHQLLLRAVVRWIKPQEPGVPTA